MSNLVTVSEARATLPHLLDRVAAGEEVTITRHGQPVAVVVRPDALKVRRAERALAGAQSIQDLLDLGRRTPLAKEGSISAAWGEELIGEVRAGRNSR